LNQVLSISIQLDGCLVVYFNLSRSISVRNRLFNEYLYTILAATVYSTLHVDTYDQNMLTQSFCGRCNSPYWMWIDDATSEKWTAVAAVFVRNCVVAISSCASSAKRYCIQSRGCRTVISIHTNFYIFFSLSFYFWYYGSRVNSRFIDYNLLKLLNFIQSQETRRSLNIFSNSQMKKKRLSLRRNAFNLS